MAGYKHGIKLPDEVVNKNKITFGPNFGMSTKNVGKGNNSPQFFKGEIEKGALIRIQRFIKTFLFRKRLTANFILNQQKRQEIKAKLPISPSKPQSIRPSLIKSPQKQQSPSKISAADMVKRKNKLFSLCKNKLICDIQLVLEECKMCLNSTDKYGNSPLYYAVKQGNFELVNAMLFKGVKVNFQNENGNTALHIAMSKNMRGICGILLAHGADFRIVNTKGETPLMLANGKLIEELGIRNK